MASGISTIFLPSDPDELCDKFNFRRLRLEFRRTTSRKQL